jgi:hypothetical protein
MTTFFHIVGGKRYNTRAMDNPPSTIEEYRDMIRNAYGSLRGVKVGIESDDS